MKCNIATIALVTLSMFAAETAPAYEPPPFDLTLQEFATGGSITKNGLVFNDFRIVSGHLSAPFPAFPPVGNAIDLTQAGASVLHGAYGAGVGSVVDPLFDDWIFIGGQSVGGLVTATGRQTWGVIYSFNVMSASPATRIAAATVESFVNFNANFINGGINVDTTIIADDGASPPLVVRVPRLAVDLSTLVGQKQASFAPQQKITVQTAISIAALGTVQFTSLIHSFRLVPEPGTSTLVGLACAMLLVRRRRAAGA